MDVRSPFYQNVATALIGILFLNPIVSTAAELTVAAGSNTSLTQAGNGVPIVNIATPNGNGLSHNKFTDYNVGQQGLILNNATAKTQATQLGGLILGNAKLNGTAAKLILNEVNGANPSTLKGYTEVAGQGAHVVVANPHGITCNGCGFINTPRVTLSTGKPLIEGGRLDRFDVDGGQISIEGSGLNASNIDQFDLITRSTKLNAELHAKQLNVITGRNQVKADDLAVTVKAADGSAKPLLAIDSSALGGMYAGAIRLVGTEQGVGVKLAGNLAASAGDIRIDANGQLSLAQAVASADVRLKAQSLDLAGPVYAGKQLQAQASGAVVNRQSLAARERVELRGGQLINQGVIEAGVNPDNSRNLIGDVALSGQSLRNSGSVVARRDLSATLSQQLDNRGGTLSGKANAAVAAATLNNSEDGRVLSEGSLTVVAGGLDNDAGLIASGKDLSVTATTELHNQAGEISSQAALTLDGDRLDNRGGLIAAGSALTLTAGSLDNSGTGTLSSQGSLAATVTGKLDNHGEGALLSQGALSVQAQELDNSQAGVLSSKTSLTVTQAALNNQGGVIVAEQQLSLTGKSLDNSNGGLVSGKVDVDVDVEEVLDNHAQGTLLADGKLVVEAAELRNGDRGQVAAKGDLQVTVDSLSQQGDATTQAGELLSQGKLTLVAKNIDNRQGGLIAATQGLDIRASNSLHNGGGEVSTQGKAVLHVLADDGQPAALLDNSGAGRIIGDQGLELTVQRLLNNAKGVLAGRDNLVLIGASLDNSAGGTLSSQTALSVELSGALTNREQGALLSGGSLTVGAKSLDNGAGGLLSSKGALNVNRGSLDNRGGTLLSDGQLTISNSSLDNSDSGVISAKQSLSIGTGQLDNQQKGLISGGAGLTIVSAQLNNHDQGLIAGEGAVQVTASGLDQHNNGQLLSETALTLDLQGGKLNNSTQGLIATPGALLLNNLGQVDNSAGGEISSAQRFLLKADELDNRGGRIISGQALELQITQALLNNLKGALSAATQLTVSAASLDNSGAGVLASKGDLVVTLDDQLDNHDQGLISAGQVLTVTSGSLDNSNQGLLASGGALTLTTGAVDNQGGSLASQTSLNANSADLDNRGGMLSSQQALTLTAADVDNRDGGLIVSAAGLTLTADILDSSRDVAESGGEVSAKQALSLTVARLIQRQGRLIGEAGVSLDLLGGDLYNRGGLLFANGPLTFANLRKLDNRDAGEVSSSQSYSLNAGEIDNGEKGRLISADHLTLELGSGTLRNAGEGLVSGLKGLTVNAGNLDNSGAGTLSSRDGALAVTLSGSEQVLNNSGKGALVSKGTLDVHAKTLNNSGKGILSSAGDLGLTLDGKLDNHDGGLIDTQGALTLTAGEVDNRSGQIGSQLAGSLSAASLDNSAGKLFSAAALTLTLTGKLLNMQKAQLASAGPLVLTAGAIDNRGGSLISQDLLSLSGSSLNNADGGTLAARNALDIVLTGALTNSTDGLIHSETGALDIQAQSLDNAGGTLHSQGDLTLTLSGTLGNQSGRIESQAGNLNLKKSSAVDNSGGLLASLTGWLELVSAGLFDNDAGTAQAQSVKITAKGVDNRAGHISALSGDTELIATGATVNNQGGGLYADKLLKVTAGAFNNQGTEASTGGKVAAGKIDFGLSGALNNSFGLIESASTLSLIANGFSNGSGSLRSLGSTGTTLIRGGLLDNRSGLIETANTALQLDVSGLQNEGGRIRHVGTGSFGLSATNVMAAGGSLSSNGLLDITATSWVNSSVLQAGTLTLNIGTFTQTASGQLLANQSLTGTGGTWTNHGLLASDGTVNLTLTGSYGGSGRLTSLGDLSLKGASIDLPTTARISGGGLTTVTSTGLLTNRGSLTSAADLTVRAATLNNYGTLGSAEQLRLYAPTLLNQSGLIFSGDDMALRVDNFTNRYADVYSLGGLDVARDDLGTWSASINNLSAVIESAEDLTLNTNLLSNKKDKFEVESRLESASIGVRCYDCTTMPSFGGPSHLIWMQEFKAEVVEDSLSANIFSGANLSIKGGSVENERSVIAAASDISISAIDFKNEGSSVGNYTSYKYIALNPEKPLWEDIVNFNQYNDIEYNRDIRFWNSSMEESRVESTYRSFGGKPIDRELTQYFGSMSLYHGFNLLQGSGVVNDFGAAAYNGLLTFGSSKYSSDIRVNAPAAIRDANSFSELIISGVPASSSSALVQAGGSLSITATSSISNGVVSEGVAHVLGSSRVGDTAALGTGKTTVVQLNSQLPPDLQQQQINPLTLPGFSLPQGENGLFRLNGQNAAASAASGALGATGDSTLAGSSVTVGAGQTAQGPAASSGSTWSLQSGQDTGSAIGATPIGAASLGVTGVQSLPSSTVPSASHKYLIETSPELTNLRQFLGSDYLLGNLGYTPDNTQKRLGDGLYEQRLIREAVVARTGQRFLAGLSSDEAMFRYLMDNAIVSKQALNLSLGITLTAAQVAALTHDIVWLEEYEVLGEKVLVPVLYLAQAKGRLAPNGALIQGQDVALISGGDLLNQGTLRASHNLSAVAGGSIGNRGLIEAGNRLDLLASDSIRNAQGGIIAGRDVSLTALTGDVINERSVTRHEVNFGNRHTIQDFADAAARIEAANSLSIDAGRDVANLGGVFDSRGDLDIRAGRDVTIASVEQRSLQARGSRYLDEQVRQLGAQISAGRDLDIRAGRDLTAIASQIDARRDISLVAGQDVTLAAAANESHFYSKGKKVTRSTDRVVQQASVIQAGRDIAIDAGEDLTVVASQVRASNNIALDAEQDINILSAKDESASFYSKKSKGSFGRSKSKQKEKYDSTNVASVIEAGNDLTLNTSKAPDGSLSIDGGRDVTVIGSQLSAGNDLLVGATGDVAVLSGIEEHGSYSKKTKSGFLGLSKSGKSQLKTKASQVASELEAGNDVVIAAGNDIRLRASETTAGNDVELRAGLVTDTGDINLVSANDTAYSRSERYSKKVGVSLSGGMLSIGSAKKAGEEARSSTSVGSQVAAERDAILQAERDINVIGSSVSAGRNLLIDAGRDINVLAAESQSAGATSERNRHSGVDLNSDSNGFTAFVGNDVQVEKTLVTRNTAAASQLQAGIDLDLQAGRDINQTGSDLQAGRDINLGAIRNITLDAAAERVTNEREEVGQRNGLTANMSHNFANTVDAIKGIGQGENIVSQVSSVLKAADSVTQFVSGPTTANHIGITSQRTGTIEGVVSNRPSTLVEGRDVNIQAGNDIKVRGTHIQTQRDINMAARDITLDVARGERANVSEQTLSQSGINGGSTFNSSRVGIGGSHGTITEDGQWGTSLPTQLEAGRDVNLRADRDLGLIGTQVLAQRDIDLKAGNDLNIRAAQKDADYDMRRKSGGGEVGLALGGQDFISVYASVDIGKGKLDREGTQQQEAYLYAGKGLNFESGRDTTIAGARMEGGEVTGKVGRDLLVSSVTDTGKVSGKEFDASMTVSVGLYGSFSVSGSVGVGKTNGSTDWVQGQTAITARDRLDIRTENHTQLDGAVLASNTGNLKLDTNTLGFRDIEGHDREHAWYINAGGSYSSGGDSGPNAAATAAVVDTSQENKDGSNSWNLSGYDNRIEREQVLRATVGLGEVVVRGDADTGRDSTAGLNRDVSQAFEITKDKKESTELYVSSSSLDAVTSPVETLESWTAGAQNYGRNAVQAFVNMELLKTEALSAAENNKLVAALAWAPELLVNAMDAMNIPTLGIFPGPANYGGLFTQLPVLVAGDLRPARVSGSFKTENGELVLVDGKPVVESQTVEKFEGFNNDDSIFTNGIMNSLTEALANGLIQAGNGSGNVDFVLAYNPTHGLIGDLVESAFDKNLSGSVLSGTARNLNDLFQGAVDAGPESLRIYGHSQGGLLTWVAVKGMDFSNVQMTSIQLSGAPVDAIQFHRDADAAGFKNDDQRVFQVNRPDESVFFGLLPKTDTVADLPVFLGGNSQYSDDPVKRALGALFTVTSLFAQDSPHSNYSCINCPTATPNNVNTQIRDIVIKPTLIDSQGNATRLP